MKRNFRVGDHVTFPWGVGREKGTVIEERGPIGARGRLLYTVEVPNDPFDPTTLEIAADEMEIAEPLGEKELHLSAAEIIDYLKNGGLILILRSNLGGKNQPRVWLCRDSLGNVTHTFYEERGLVGGETVPFWTVYEDSVFAPEHDKVAKYLRNFGLSKAQVEDVLAAVGTAP